MVRPLLFTLVVLALAITGRGARADAGRQREARPGAPAEAPAAGRVSRGRETFGVGLHLATMFTLGDAAAEATFATGLDLRYWHEAGGLALEPRLGFRKDFDIDQDGGFRAYTAGLGVYAARRTGDLWLFGGGGAAMRYLTERTYETFLTGSVLVIEHKLLHDDSTFAPTGFAGGGLQFVDAGGSGVRTVVACELEASPVTVNGRRYPVTLQLSLGVVF